MTFPGSEHIDTRGRAALRWLHQNFGINVDAFTDFNDLLLALAARTTQMERRVDALRTENKNLQERLSFYGREREAAERYLKETSIELRCPVCGKQFPDTIIGEIPLDRCNGIHARIA